MVDTAGTTEIVTGMLPKFKGAGILGINFFAWVLIIVLFMFIAGLGAFFLIRWLKYNKKIVFFEKIGGEWIPTKIDKAMEVKFSTAGDTIFYLLKSRRYVPNPTYQMGKRVYWLAIRSDGEIVNFKLKDLDKEAQDMGAKFLDKEMRYARTQIQRGLKERYDKPSFWQQYGLLIFSLAYIVVIGVMMWLLFDKWIDLAGATNSGVQQAENVLKEVERIMSSMDNICRGGSGLVPA